MEINKKFIICNQKYIIIYHYNTIYIYKMDIKIDKNLLLNFNFSDNITDIQFNPILDNVILISFDKGFCKIYEIEKEKIIEKITFEGINDKYIEQSKFNYLNTNIIASLIENNTIIIWDVNNIKYINVIDYNKKIKIIEKEKNQEEREKMKEEKGKKEEEKEKEEKMIINIEWNRLFQDLLKIKEKKYIKFINIKTGEIPIILENDGTIKDAFFLESYTIVIKRNEITKINNNNNNNNSKLQFTCISSLNDCLINDKILIIFDLGKIQLIDLTNMEIVQEIEFVFDNNSIINNFYYDNNNNEIFFYYFEYENILEKFKITLNKKISDINKNCNRSNINMNNNFYHIYQKNISKYINILDFDENVNENEEKINKKKYMDIEEIMIYFREVKKIDIFYRKDFIKYIFEGNISGLMYEDILNENYFKKIKELSKLFNIED